MQEGKNCDIIHILAEVAEWTIVADCKSAGRKAYPGSNPGLSTLYAHRQEAYQSIRKRSKSSSRHSPPPSAGNSSFSKRHRYAPRGTFDAHPNLPKPTSSSPQNSYRSRIGRNVSRRCEDILSVGKAKSRTCEENFILVSRREDSNPQPSLYKSAAQPLSYVGDRRNCTRRQRRRKISPARWVEVISP